MAERKLIILKDEGSFAVASVSDQELPGVFLSAGYLSALHHLVSELSASARSAKPEVRQAAEQMLSMVEVVFNAQQAAMPYRPIDIKKLKREMDDLIAKLKGGDDGPSAA